MSSNIEDSRGPVTDRRAMKLTWCNGWLTFGTEYRECPVTQMLEVRPILCFDRDRAKTIREIGPDTKENTAIPMRSGDIDTTHMAGTKVRTCAEGIEKRCVTMRAVTTQISKLGDI